MQFTRTRYGLLAALLGIAALMLAGCGGDDGGLSTEDMARLSAAEEATAAAQAAAAAAQAEAAAAHEEAEAAQAEAMMAHEEAEAATMEAEEARMEAEAATMAAEEAMMEDEKMAETDTVTLEDLYEELAGEKIEADLRMRVGTEGPLSTTVLKKAIEETAKYYHLDATSAIAYIEENYPTFEVLQRAAVETILEVLHMDNNHLSATAMTAEMVLKGEKGDTGDDGTPAADDDTIADLKEQIAKAANRRRHRSRPCRQGAKVIQTAGGLSLSTMAADYDFGMIMLTDMSKDNAVQRPKKGIVYGQRPHVGFAGLNDLEAGGDGADVFGSWLEYSHWAVVMGENGEMSTFSLGMPTGANPEPQDDDKLSAKWTGTMTGAWKAAQSMAADGSRDSAINAADQEFETVRGDASIAVAFTPTGTGYKAAATLSVNNLVQSDGAKLGDFRPGDTLLGPAGAATDNYTNVWTGMTITKGDFSRRSITTAMPADGATAAAVLATNMRDGAGAEKYLAGRFYDMAGDEVGGVFMEDGQISGYVTATSTKRAFPTDTADAPTATNVSGILVGAFGGGRVTPVTP